MKKKLCKYKVLIYLPESYRKKKRDLNNSTMKQTIVLCKGRIKGQCRKRIIYRI